MIKRTAWFMRVSVWSLLFSVNYTAKFRCRRLALNNVLVGEFLEKSLSQLVNFSMGNTMVAKVNYCPTHSVAVLYSHCHTVVLWGCLQAKHCGQLTSCCGLGPSTIKPSTVTIQCNSSSITDIYTDRARVFFAIHSYI